MGLGRLILEKNRQKRDYLGIFSLKGGGPLFPNVYVRILTKSEHFCKNQKGSLGPETQKKPKLFFWDEGFPKGGDGGGSDVWEKFPNNPVFFFEGVPYRLEIQIGNEMGSKRTIKFEVLDWCFTILFCTCATISWTALERKINSNILFLQI